MKIEKISFKLAEDNILKGMLNEDLEIPSDETLKGTYPDLEYPGQRKQQWYNDQKAKSHKAKSVDMNKNKSLTDLKDTEKKELLTRISDMIAVSHSKGDDRFIKELMDLLDSHPDLVRDYAATRKDIMADQPKPNGPWFIDDYVKSVADENRRKGHL